MFKWKRTSLVSAGDSPARLVRPQWTILFSLATQTHYFVRQQSQRKSYLSVAKWQSLRDIVNSIYFKPTTLVGYSTSSPRSLYTADLVEENLP